MGVWSARECNTSQQQSSVGDNVKKPPVRHEANVPFAIHYDTLRELQNFDRVNRTSF